MDGTIVDVCRVVDCSSRPPCPTTHAASHRSNPPTLCCSNIDYTTPPLNIDPSNPPFPFPFPVPQFPHRNPINQSIHPSIYPSTRLTQSIQYQSKKQVGVLEELASKSGFKLNFKESLIGGAALDAKDDPFPDESLKA
jgi:hypothetical protein